MTIPREVGDGSDNLYYGGRDEESVQRAVIIYIMVGEMKRAFRWQR